jgi:charged multivesicular body protein 2A
MRDFERESGVMDAKQDMMDDMIDDAMGDEEDEGEAESMVQQVLEELGLDVGAGLVDAEAAKPVPAQAEKAEDEDLMARLNALRKED